MSSTCNTNVWTLLTVCVIAVCILPVQLQVVTNGDGGEPCPEKKCLDGRADCINNSCICRPPFQLDPDNGNFACYRSNNVFGEMRNDPTVRNFNDEIAQFPFPCRYLFTSTTTTLRINKMNVGSCKCEVYSWNDKFRGKLYPGGFDYSCLLTNTELNSVLGFSVRLEGIAENGVYQYREYAVAEDLPNGPWPANPRPLNFAGAGIVVKSNYDTVNNQYRISLLECGYVITFRAYDIGERRNQTEIPGLSVGINCGLDPFFHEHDRVIATAPVRFGGTRYEDLADPPLTVPDVLLIRGFTSNVAQNQRNLARQCLTLGGYLNQCSPSELPRVLEFCFFFLDAPRFSRCLDGGDDIEPLLNIIESCVASSCTGDVSCKNFQTKVTASGCQNTERYPELEEIIDPNFCP